MSDATLPTEPPGNPASPVAPDNLYPKLIIPKQEHPNRLYAFPFFGILVRLILAIPSIILLFLLIYAYLGVTIINSFYILFKRKFWQPAHAVIVAYLTYANK